jgi:hypothetical protein
MFRAGSLASVVKSEQFHLQSVGMETPSCNSEGMRFRFRPLIQHVPTYRRLVLATGLGLNIEPSVGRLRKGRSVVLERYGHGSDPRRLGEFRNGGACASEKVVQSLNPADAGVLDGSATQFLQPLDTDVSAGGDVAERRLRPVQELVCSVEQRLRWLRHTSSVGKTLPVGQRVTLYATETLYPTAPIRWIAMMDNALQRAKKALGGNTKTLQGEGRQSGASIAKAAELMGIKAAPKTINNVHNPERHDSSITSVAAFAAVKNVEVWELFVPNLPAAGARASLRAIVEAFGTMSEDDQKALALFARNARKATQPSDASQSTRQHQEPSEGRPLETRISSAPLQRRRRS